MTTTAKTPATRRTAVGKPTSLQEAANLLAKYGQLYNERAEIMAAAKEAAQPLTEQLDKLTAALHFWADNNAPEFSGKKMLKLEQGEFGYRAGLKKVKLPLDLDLKKYLETVRKAMPTAIDEEVNARAIIQGWDHIDGLSAKLGKLGVTVEQLDNFIITPKK